MKLNRTASPSTAYAVRALPSLKFASHHSATDYQANKDDINGKLIGRTICDRAQEKWKKEYPNYKCDYHLIIGHTGEVFEAQPIEQPAWHCTNYQANLVSIGICFLGNFENIKMPTEQFNAGVKLIKDLMKQYNIPLITQNPHFIDNYGGPGILMSSSS